MTLRSRIGRIGGPRGPRQGSVRTWMLVLAVVLGLVTASAEQETRPQSAPLFRAGVNLVALEVSVLDKHRQPVTGLTAADFTVLDDGAPRPVVAFSAVTLPEAVAAPTADWMTSTSPDVVTNQVDARRLVVLVFSGAHARLGPLGHAVIDHLGPEDLAAVVFLTRPELGQDFTVDRTKLHDAVDRVQTPPTGSLEPVWPLDRLTTLLASLGPLADRRKVVFFITGGRYIGIFSARTELYRTAQRAGVTINCLSPRILAPPADDMCKELASNTGGDAVTDTNLPEEEVPALFRASGSYYLLGFEPVDAKADAAVRRVEVKVDRPDVEVRTATVRDAAPATALPNSRVAMADALASPVSVAAIPLQMSAIPLAKGRGATANVVVILSFRLTGIPWSHADVQEVEIDAMADTGVIEHSGRESVRWAARSMSGDREGTIFAQVELPPGAHELRASLHSTALGATGSIFSDVSIPEFAKDALSLSGVSVHTDAPQTQIGAEALRAWVPSVPTTSRTFAASDHVTTSIVIYQGGEKALADVTVTLQVRNEKNVVVSTRSDTLGAERFQLGRRLEYSLALPLDRLSPGRYLATLVGTAGDMTAERDLQFAIR